MRNLQQLVRKNLKLLFRSKSSVVIFLLGPLFLVLLAGLAFDTTQLQKLQIGYTLEGKSEVKDYFMDKLTQKNFKSVFYKEEENCIQALKKGDIHVCLSFSHEDEMVIFADYSRLNLVWEIMHVMSSEISLASSELSLELAKNIVRKFEFARQELKKNKDIIISFTTDNERANQQIDDIIALIQSSGVPLNVTLLQGIDVDLGENDFVDWYTKVSDLLGKVGQEYRRVSDDILAKINDVAISEVDKLELIIIVDDGKDAIREIEDTLRLSGSKAYDELGNLGGLISGLLENIGQLQEKLNKLGGFRESSVERLRGIQRSLDHNLIKLLELQKTVNVIEEGFQSISLTDTDDLLSPIKTTIQPVTAQVSTLSYIFPLMLVLIIMFTGVFLSLTIVSLDKQSPAKFRDFMIPLPGYIFPLSLFLTSFIILGTQLLVLFLVGSIFYGIDLLLSLPSILVLSLPFISFFIFLGMSIAVVVKKEEIGSLAGVSFCTLFLLLSDVIIPLERMPLFFRDVFSYNPLVLGNSLFKKILLLQLPVTSLLFELGMLSLYTVLLFVFLYKRWKK